MPHDSFRDRERAEEAAYFGRQDALLIEKIRSRAKLSEIAHAMGDKLRVDDPALLDRIAKLGVTRDTAAAFLLAPLVEIAWADGHVSEAERDVIVKMATSRGVAADSPDMAQLLQWLKEQPSHDLFAAALDTLKLGLSILPLEEARQRAAAMVDTCRSVAQAAGGLERLLSLRSAITPHERSVLAEIRARLAAG